MPQKVLNQSTFNVFLALARHFSVILQLEFLLRLCSHVTSVPSSLYGIVVIRLFSINTNHLLSVTLLGKTVLI